MPAAGKALPLAQPIPSFLKELNSLGKKMSSSQKDPLQILKLNFILLLETKLLCKDNQIPFSQWHRQLTADAAHSKGTERKSSQFARWFSYPVSFGQCVDTFLFGPLENTWRGHTAFKPLLALPWVKLAPSLPWREVSAAGFCMSSFISTDMPEIENFERAGLKEQQKYCSW